MQATGPKERKIRQHGCLWEAAATDNHRLNGHVDSALGKAWDSVPKSRQNARYDCGRRNAGLSGLLKSSFSAGGQIVDRQA
jgi:hypothetical protein